MGSARIAMLAIAAAALCSVVVLCVLVLVGLAQRKSSTQKSQPSTFGTTPSGGAKTLTTERGTGGGKGGSGGGSGGGGGGGGGGPVGPGAPQTSSTGEVVADVWSNPKTYSVNATYYGPDRINGIHGGNDNIFEHIPSGGYTADQLHKIGSHFCAITDQFLKKGFMGRIIHITGSKGSFDAVIVDMLPDRHDGRNIQIDIHDENDWLALGGDEQIGVQPITFKVVGTASIPPTNSAWNPKSLGFDK